MRSSGHIMRGIAVLSLLGVYLCAVVSTNLHLTGAHDHQAHEQCNPESDRNACHLAIYHNDDVRGCRHPGHISDKHDDCELCAAICHFQPLPITHFAATEKVAGYPGTPLAPTIFVSQYSQGLSPARGPPT